MSTQQQQDKWNTTFGVPPLFDATSFLWIQICLTFCVGTIAVLLSHRALQLSRVPTSLLWIFYYCIGLVFHFSALLAMDASSVGFLAPTAIHVYVEGFLCIQALTMKDDSETTNAWGRYWTYYFCTVTFASWCLWQPLSFFVFGSLVALPIDTLTLPAALAILQDAAPREPRRSDWWYLGVTWSFNTPIVALIFAQLVWGAKTTNSNAAAVTLVLLQVQYICLGVAVLRTFGRPWDRTTSSGSRNYESVPNATTGSSATIDETSTPVWNMRRGLRWTVILLGVQVVFSVLVPLGLGRIDLDMIVQPWVAYLPGVHGY